jgi:ABC-type branched-subunit amino acid transport system permease subunit
LPQQVFGLTILEDIVVCLNLDNVRIGEVCTAMRGDFDEVNLFGEDVE